MSTDGPAESTDLIRWTFTVPEAAAEAVAEHLTDLGADVFLGDGMTFHVTWDEPEIDLDPVVEALWTITGVPFEITQEEFHRLAHHILQHESEDGDEEAEPEAHDRPHRPAEPTGEFHPGFDSLETLDL